MMRVPLAILAGVALSWGATSGAEAGGSGDYLETRTADVYTGPCFANAEVNLRGKEALALAGPAASAPLLTTAKLDPPGTAAAPVREALAPVALRVEEGGRVLAEIWLRREVPPCEKPAAGLGVSFGRLGPGTLVGLARFPDGWTDYRKVAIAAGAYTLRYAVQPDDGNHMGVSEYRDFLLLAPAALDLKVEAPEGGDALVALSRKATGTAHPAALALFPVAKDAVVPALVSNDLEQPMIAARVGPFTVGLVVAGCAGD